MRPRRARCNSNAAPGASTTAAVEAKFGVPPAAIPDYLALVGDSADGYPGLPGWGARSTAAVLHRFGHIEAVPLDAVSWDIGVRGAGTLAQTLREKLHQALLFKDLATLRTDADLFKSVHELEWRGPGAGFDAFCGRIDAAYFLARISARASGRSS
jgi:5'-3' exonuclease